MNIDLERTSFTSMLESSEFGGALQVSQPLIHSEMQPTFELQDMMSMGAPHFMKHQPVTQVSAPTSTPLKLPADQSIPNVLQNMMSRSNSSKITPSNIEASLLSLVDGELRVSSISNLSIFLKVLPRCKTEPEQTLALVVLRATSTAKDTKLSRACATTFEKGGGLRLARTWVDSAVAWEHNDLLVLLLEVLQTLPLQLTSITEARINEPIVKLRKNAQDERVKRVAQDLLKFWRGKFTEKEKSSSVAKAKTQESSGLSSSATPSAKQAPHSTASLGATKSVPLKQPKVLKKRTIKRLERLPFGGGGAVSKSSDLIGNLMQRKSAKDAAAAAADEGKKKIDSSNVNSSTSLDNDKEEPQSRQSSAASKDLTSVDDALSMPLPTIQSFKAASTSVDTTKERKRIRWADETGVELVKVKFIESWRDLVPFDPQHEEQSFKDAKLREHANERHALLAHHQKVPAAVAASQSREWTTPAFIRLPDAVAARLDSATVTNEIHIQDRRRRLVDEYEVLAGEMPIPSPKEWERGNEPHRGPPLEIPLNDVVGTEPAIHPPPAPAVVMAPPTSSGSYSGGYSQPPRAFDQRGFINRSEHNVRQDPETDRKLREALGPLQENTVALLLDNADVVPQVLEEAQRHGNRISDARVFEIVDQYRRGRFQPPLNVGGPPPHAFNPFGSQHPPYGDLGSGACYPPQPYQQHYPPQQHPRGGPFMPGKRNADAMSSNGMMPDVPQPLKRPTKKARGVLSCRYFASPMGCKHGGNCHYAHVQPAQGNGPELIYNHNGPMMVGRGGPMYNSAPMLHGVPSHHLRGGR
ncbi:hypothetical protein PsorP6_008217 [Peronosclerospora sorghi]|uniref:Uncharacterized protein n=1 Tax=Peronosclerospora sorghi TaxID=230839 RepID=A0ACC0W8L6_9STRA|nr:hypothetical protein PsorP6_008217 [Peronosclerospora sorghi]